MPNQLDLVCWKCGASLSGVWLPMRRLEVCPECDSELHVCRLCRFYDPNVIDQCTEEGAEEVREKERANFCDYYKPRPGAYHVRDVAQSETARRRLDALFGGASEEDPDESPGSANKALQDLFD